MSIVLGNVAVSAGACTVMRRLMIVLLLAIFAVFCRRMPRTYDAAVRQPLVEFSVTVTLTDGASYVAAPLSQQR